MTAAHVVFERAFVKTSSGIEANLTADPNLKVTLKDGRKYNFTVDPSANDNRQNARLDLAVIKTPAPSDGCFLELDKEALPLAGDHEITIGVPNWEYPNQALFEGTVASYATQTNNALGVLAGDQTIPVYRRFPMIDVQMPIVQGLSGSPLITDSDTVIGVITEEPLRFTKQLGQWINNYNPALPLSQDDGPQSSVSALGWTAQQYLAAGTGLAVPVRFLDPANFAKPFLEAGLPVGAAVTQAPVSLPH